MPRHRLPAAVVVVAPLLRRPQRLARLLPQPPDVRVARRQADAATRLHRPRAMAA